MSYEVKHVFKLADNSDFIVIIQDLEKEGVLYTHGYQIRVGTPGQMKQWSCKIVTLYRNGTQRFDHALMFAGSFLEIPASGHPYVWTKLIGETERGKHILVEEPFEDTESTLEKFGIDLHNE